MALEDLESLEPLLPPDKSDVGAHPAACPVIGLGSSAGGLEAFQAFLKALPVDLGYAYVLVQHLDPNHESMLAELLSRRTTMPVRQVVDGMVIEPNAVYLIPPNHSLTIEKARLRLSDFVQPRGFRRPIDGQRYAAYFVEHAIPVRHSAKVTQEFLVGLARGHGDALPFVEAALPKQGARSLIVWRRRNDKLVYSFLQLKNVAVRRKGRKALVCGFDAKETGLKT